MIPATASSISEMLFFLFFLSLATAKTVNRVYLIPHAILKL